jgi:hypothetical protein
VSDTALRLRATSDALLRDLEALTALEDEKRTIPASDPRLTDLARRIHEIAGRVLQRSADQEALTLRSAEAAAQRPAASGGSAGAMETRADLAIEDVKRSPASILAEWRAVEQRAGVIDPGSPEGAELRILADRLREEYRTAFEARLEE